jgi:hypothetical protein
MSAPRTQGSNDAVQIAELVFVLAYALFTLARGIHLRSAVYNFRP